VLGSEKQSFIKETDSILYEQRMNLASEGQQRIINRFKDESTGKAARIKKPLTLYDKIHVRNQDAVKNMSDTTDTILLLNS